MFKNISKYTLTFFLTSFLIITIPTITYANGINNLTDILIVAQQKTIINYEKSQPSSIDNPVVDPNFNVMRKFNGYLYSDWFTNCSNNNTFSYMVVFFKII